jgi:ATP-dependent helicase YprA (DUF1998 family)
MKILKGLRSQFPYQLNAAVVIATGRDTVLIAPPGAWKTLVFAMRLLHHNTMVSIVISPLQASETENESTWDQMHPGGYR